MTNVYLYRLHIYTSETVDEYTSPIIPKENKTNKGELKRKEEFDLHKQNVIPEQLIARDI